MEKSILSLIILIFAGNVYAEQSKGCPELAGHWICLEKHPVNIAQKSLSNGFTEYELDYGKKPFKVVTDNVAHDVLVENQTIRYIAFCANNSFTIQTSDNPDFITESQYSKIDEENLRITITVESPTAGHSDWIDCRQ